MMVRYFFVLLAGCILPLSVMAQERCSTTRYEAQRQANRPGRETAAQFESWMKSRLANPPQITSATYTIPVVVHVLHNGTGDVTDISDAQILSQIDVLNKDFKRLNLDASNTPSEFAPVAGSIDIDFVLAKRDPEGLPTNGITRTQATKTQWTMADQSAFKALSYWPAEDYLNIWIVNFGTNDIGFAQFPVSSLEGLDIASEDRLTDGIVVDYRAFGSIDAGSFPLLANYNKGRTTTHEIGHFLGLRHIWGDLSTCADNDFVSDTPFQNGPTSFCPSHPQISCSANKMFMNYMDYTYDACMNLFTAGQVARMVVVLAGSPRRASLLTSPGATLPVVAMNDLGIRQIISPTASTCVEQIVPQLEFRNYGTNTITSASVEINADGQITQVPLTLNLAPGQIATQAFSPVVLAAGSAYNFSFSILTTNGGSDGNPQNDQAARNVSYYANSTLPVIEPFNSVPANWIVANPDNQIGWTNVTAPDNSPSNKAMKIAFYDYDTPGVLDWIISPAFNLATPSSSLLRFDVAYAMYPGQNEDALRVYALPDCNTDLDQAILLYEKTGAALSTSTTTSNPFLPTSAAQWRKSELVSLGGLSPATRWQLAFVSRNGYGNNCYLDNVTVTENEINDIALLGIVSPGIVHCQTNAVIRIRVANLSTLPVQDFDVDFSVAGGMFIQNYFRGISLDVGEVDTFDLSPIELRPGPNQVTVTIRMLSGTTEILTENNTFSFISMLDLSQDRGPLRVTFDNPNEQPWRVASPSDGQSWESVVTNKDQSLTYRSFTNPAIGQESWLVSPVLDLSATPFSLFFEVSYAKNVPADDRLLVLASRDCGVNYDEVLMDRAASSFADISSTTEWEPKQNGDWRREYINLESLAYLQNIRLAFVVRNDNGNNLFLDNIELFVGDQSDPPLTTAPYQLYYSSRNSQSDIALTFHLDKRQDVSLQILSLQGNLVAEHLLSDALNQTYYFDLGQQASGLYIFRLFIDNTFRATKVFIGH